MTSSQSPDLKREEYGRQTNGEKQHCTGWRGMNERPQPRSKVALLWMDGSGAQLYYVTDNGELIDGEDGCTYSWESRDGFWIWSYLPWSYSLWIETCDEPFTLPAPPSSEEPRGIPSEASSSSQTRDEMKTLRAQLADAGVAGAYMRARAEEAEAQLALAVGVLRPFAAMAGTTIRFTATDSTRVFVDTEHFKAAAQALAALSPQEGEGE